MQAIEGEVVKPDSYSVGDLRKWVCVMTRRRIPESTFRYWRSRAGVTPNDNNCFGDKELNYLVALSDWLEADRNNTIRSFKEHKKNGN